MKNNAPDQHVLSILPHILAALKYCKWKVAATGIMAISLVTVTVISKTADIYMVWDAFKAAFRTLQDVFWAFVIFWIVAFLIGIFASIGIKKVHVRISLMFGIASFFCLLYFSSKPIVCYVDPLYSWFGESIFWSKTLSLLLSNALLYFFLYTFVFEIVTEYKKLYVVSAPYKLPSYLGPRGAKIHYLKERVLWIFLGNTSPLLLYLFSFTVFTDYLLQGETDAAGGVVGDLLRFAMEDASYAQFFTYLLSMALVIMPLKIFLDTCLYAWESKRSMLV
ncbi:hypothetical protein [Desulfatibacillum aliphaticivorans]|uniref:hypothetical protein n=1 Tax=Desulfatibacillum aliphaticivorans TaxID=218208 RepID=UPI00040EF971|nr:hypothetical protein [Desulfatibacillum aliphaticivorans]